MTKTKNRFGISNFGHWDLFDICDLLFGIYIPLVLQRSSQFLPGKILNSDLALRTRFSILDKGNVTVAFLFLVHGYLSQLLHPLHEKRISASKPIPG
jgi:hypothetical protein